MPTIKDVNGALAKLADEFRAMGGEVKVNFLPDTAAWPVGGATEQACGASEEVRENSDAE